MLLVGPIGPGTTHLGLALGVEAARRLLAHGRGDETLTTTLLDRLAHHATFQVGRLSFLLLNVHLFYGSQAKADIERRALETFAVARWAKSQRDSPFSFAREIVALGDFEHAQARTGRPDLLTVDEDEVRAVHDVPGRAVGGMRVPKREELEEAAALLCVVRIVMSVHDGQLEAVTCQGEDPVLGARQEEPPRRIGLVALYVSPEDQRRVVLGVHCDRYRAKVRFGDEFLLQARDPLALEEAALGAFREDEVRDPDLALEILEPQRHGRVARNPKAVQIVTLSGRPPGGAQISSASSLSRAAHFRPSVPSTTSM